MSDRDPDDDSPWMTPEDQIGALKARVENLLRDQASLTRLAQSVPVLQARVEALTAELAAEKAEQGRLRALVGGMKAYLEGAPSNPPTTGRAKVDLTEFTLPQEPPA